MSKQQAQQEVINRAIQELSNIDIVRRCTNLGFEPKSDNTASMQVFGDSMTLNLSDFSLTSSQGKPARVNDYILVLHYLLNEAKAPQSGELCSFRDFSGGQFYWDPFLSRSIKPLVGRVRNDLDLLKTHLDQRFDWDQGELGDFSAKIHAFADIHLTLIYRCGDDEFPPSAEAFFDSSLKHMLCTEDAAVIASRICIGLL